jgi:hypothetical protein
VEPTKRERDFAKEDSSRNFQPNWLLQFPWLRTCSTDIYEGKEAYCNICACAANGLKKNNTFTNKRANIASHEGSKGHQDAVKLYTGGEFNAAGAEEAKRLLKEYENGGSKPNKKLETAVREGASKAEDKEFKWKEIQFRLIFALLKHFRPMTDAEWLQKALKLHEKIGELMPAKHCSDNAAWEIADAMAAVVERVMQSILSDAEFFSLTVDASARTNNDDMFNIEARVWHGGQLHLVFISMEKLGLDTTAEGHKKVLDAALENVAKLSKPQKKRKLVAVAADGCSTMQGSQGGLITLIINEQPHVVKIWCNAHKVNLASEILDRLPFFKRISDSVRAVATYFNRSPRRCAALYQYQTQLGLPLLTPIAVNDTRWMPLNGAMLNYMRIAPAVLRVLRDAKETDQQARMLEYELTSAPVLFGMLAVKPFLAKLDELTKVIKLNCHFFK